MIYKLALPLDTRSKCRS